jgi:hypothetical protein
MLRPTPLLLFAIGLLLLLPSKGIAQITEAERKGLDGALYVGNLTEKDLQFERKGLNDPYRLPIGTLALDDPLTASDRIFSLHSNATQSISDSLANACHVAFEDPIVPPQGLPTLGPLPDETPDSIRDILEILIGAIDESNRCVHQALAKLSPSERREIIEGLPIMCAADKSVHFGFTTKQEVSQDRMLALLGRVDLPAIRASGARLSHVVETQLPLLKKLASTTRFEKSMRFVVCGYRVELSSDDDAVHASRDTNLFIGFGDRNHFTGRFGAGIGYSSILIDCGNQSYYDVPDLSVGVGVLGVGLAYTTGQGDVFNGKSVCFGAGLAGVGGFSHEGSDASFRTGPLSEGFGCFGEGLLIDNGDRDVFSGRSFCQGAARTGGIGWLVELGAQDRYDSEGYAEIEGKMGTISNSQGCAAGFGSDDGLLSGGLGIVTTTGPGQSYVGGLRCQAAATWGGVASIADLGHGSTHNGIQEDQGYANHEAATFLYAMGGYGSYTTKFGTCEACASDSSVAFVMDRRGHDIFSSKDGSPARALRNSLAIFLTCGDGNTFMSEPTSAAPPATLSSLGLFCDLGAHNQYSENHSFVPIQVNDRLSVFFQSPEPLGETPFASVTGGERVQRFAPGSAPNPGESEMASEWERAKGGGFNASQARERLVGIGTPAVEFILSRELGNWNSGAASILGAIVSEVGDEARKALALDIASTDPLRRQNALRIACLAPGKGMDQAIVAALATPELRKLAARAAGLCQVHDSVSLLQPLCASSDPLLALDALIALDQIGDRASAGTAAACLTSSSWPMRRAAIELIAKFPVDAVVAASGLLAGSLEQVRRTGVEVLAAMNDQDGYRRLGHLLDDPSPGIELEALIALQNHVPDDLQAKVATLQQSLDPFVRRLAVGMPVDR